MMRMESPCRWPRNFNYRDAILSETDYSALNISSYTKDYHNSSTIFLVVRCFPRSSVERRIFLVQRHRVGVSLSSVKLRPDLSLEPYLVLPLPCLG